MLRLCLALLAAGALLLLPAAAPSADAAVPKGFFGVMVNGPLDNPAVQNATLAFLRGINPVTGGPVDTAEAAVALKDAILQNAKAQVRTYDTNSTNAGGNIDLGLGGGGVSYESKNADLTGALDYVPGQGFVPSQVCVIQ